MNLVFSCRAHNDLYRALADAGRAFPRRDSVADAVATAPEGTGVLLLADGYPEAPLVIAPEVWEGAARKRLRLYVEYPSALPGLEVGEARGTQWERAVVASDAFAPELERLRILAIHGCRFLPVPAPGAHLVLARVAGFDTAVYGLPEETYPLLFEHGDALVATTQLSRFVTGRYAPADAWGPIWRMILSWLQPGQAVPSLRWAPTVRPSHARVQVPSENVEQLAFRRGAEWFTHSRLLVHPDWKDRAEDAGQYPDRVGPMPEADLSIGDGTEGLLEGFNSTIGPDGSQEVRWWLRDDCMGESAMAFAFHGALEMDARSHAVAANLEDFIYTKSVLAQGPRADPASPSYGLVGWNTTPAHTGVFYGDDNARSLLGTMATAALLQTDRWDEPLMRCLMANLRTTGRLGFRGSRVNEPKLHEQGWRAYWDGEVVHYAPHYEAYLWACFLWAYRHTGFAPFLERTRTAIRMTMAAYPDEWRWTNGIQQERARMLLPLAWLVRLEDTPEHRAWMRRVAEDLLAHQDACGAIREEVGSAGKGSYGPPKSNAAYGTAEAPLIQQNGDPLCDLLYTTNFAFLGLHEAAAATGDPLYADAEERLAKFLCRIQVRSEAHPELDGAWFRAFDFGRWDYWASNADAGWGAWSIESGWTQGWTVSVLGLRRLGTSFWDLTAGSRAGEHFPRLQPVMFPGA